MMNLCNSPTQNNTERSETQNAKLSCGLCIKMNGERMHRYGKAVLEKTVNAGHTHSLPPIPLFSYQPITPDKGGELLFEMNLGLNYHCWITM